MGSLPIICAGDVFDDGWRPHRCPPELINFAIKHLPVMYAVPGQHDLPYHSLTDIRKSAYWTLVEADRIIHIDPNYPCETAGGGMSLRLHGFPWGVAIKPLKQPHDLVLEIAIVHSYIWSSPKNSYTGAPEEKRAIRYGNALQGYDAAVFGDNHCWIYGKVGNTYVLNTGTFFRRKSDERNHAPSVGIIYSDGSFIRHKFDCSADKFLDSGDVEKRGEARQYEELIDELCRLSDVAISFTDAVKQIMEKEKELPEVRALIMKLIGG